MKPYLLVCICLYLSSCTKTADYVEDSKTFTTQLVEQLEAEQNLDNSETHSLTFAQACLEAARNDRDIVTILEKLNQANVEVAGVSTHLWPRLNLSANSEIPLTSSDDAEFDLYGGIYFDYDIRRAIAVSDESTLRGAQADQNRLKLRLGINLLQRKLKNYLNHIQFLTYKTEKKLQALELSREAFTLAKVYAQQKRLDVAALASWKSRITRLEIELAAVRNQLKAQQYAINDLIGRNVLQPIVITDLDSILEVDNKEIYAKYTPSEIWRKHSEARLYELELIAAEAGAHLVALERLPEVNAQLGLGSIPLDSSDTNASSLVRLTLSMPLYDFGDHSRKVAKTHITRDRVRDSMKSNITKLFNRVQLAQGAYMVAQDTLLQATRAVEEANVLISKKNLLISKTRGDNLGLYPDKIHLTDLEIFQREAVTSLRKAADDFRFAAGDDIVAQTVTELIDTL